MAQVNAGRPPPANGGPKLQLQLIRYRKYEVRFCLTVWARIIGDIAVDPCLLPDRVTAQRYRDLLETVLLCL